MPRTVFPLPLNKGLNFPLSHPRIYIKKPVQAIDRIQISIDSRCLAPCISEFTSEFDYRGKHLDDDANWVWEFICYGCRVQLVKYEHENPLRRMWSSVRIQDPTKRAQEKVAEIIIMALDSLGLSHDHASVKQVEFALDFVPTYPAMLRKLTHYLQSTVTMRHGRASSVEFKGTTMYIGKDGNVRQGTKGVRCYPKEGNRVRVEVQVNKAFLRGKGVTINSLPLAADFVRVMDYALFYHRLSAREIEQIMAKCIPTLANRRTRLGHKVRADAIGEALVVQQIDVIRQFLGKHGKKFDKKRLFTEWRPRY